MKILVQNGKVRVAEGIPDIYDKLPVGVYKVQYNEIEGFYLSIEKAFTVPKKFYGDMSIVDRWLHYRNNSEGNMGILLSGLKGCGKTITGKKFCIDYNRPVILIENAYGGPEFNSFISNFNDSILFIDEFEKIYEGRDENGSNKLLSLLSGTSTTKLTFILTSNDGKINTYMLNRPGRIRYHEMYNSITPEVINEIIKDLLVDQNYAKELVNVFDEVQDLTFDIAISLINEINMFNQSPKELVKAMNIVTKPKEYDVYITYTKFNKEINIKLFNSIYKHSFYINNRIGRLSGLFTYNNVDYTRGEINNLANELLNKDDKILQIMLNDYIDIEPHDFEDSLEYEDDCIKVVLKETSTKTYSTNFVL